MALRHYQYVWKNYKKSGSHKLVLLALAEYANDSDECWPSMQTLSDMTCVSVRQIINIITELKNSGYLEVIATRGRSQSNHYKLIVKCEADCTLLSEMEAENNVKSSVNNVKSSVNNVKSSVEKCEAHFTRSVIEPNTINTLSTNVDVQSTQTSLSSDGKKQKPDKPKKASQPATDADADAEPTQTPEQQEWFGALCWLIYGHKEYKLLSKIDKIAIGKTAKEIRGLEYTIDDLRTWYKTIWCKEFPGLQKNGTIQNPRLKDIKTGIGKVKPTSHTNGFNAPVAQANVPTYKRIEQL